MIFRVSILVVASVAPFAVIRKSWKKQNLMLPAKDCSSSQQVDMAEDNIPEKDMEEEEVKVVNSKNVEKVLKPNLTQKRNCEVLELDRQWKLGNREIEQSQNLIKELEKRRVTLEGKPLELYSLKEKLSYIGCLQGNLDDKTAEVDKLNFRIYALKAEIKDLQEIIRQGNLAMKQLEKAKKMTEQMQMENGNASQIKGQIMVLEEQLSGFTTNETSAPNDMVKKKLEAVKTIEFEVVKMKRRNKELELEKRELSVKLFAAHAKISALSDMTQSKTIAKISELRHANGDLSEQVERLQKSRFDMVEELVYQRWLNACLRAEIQGHQKSSRKTLQKELPKPSDHKPRKITTQDPDMNSTSSYTSSTESEDTDSSTIESSSSGHISISKNSGIGHNSSWRSSMDGSSVVSSLDKSSTGSPLERTGIIRRLSNSMVPSKTSMPSTKLDGISSKRAVPVL
ncbi:hypothetical protein QUC31_007098 [Theobroma cacao]